MNAREIIQEIEMLPRNEQVEVIRFVYRLDAERRLSGGELTSLAERLAGTADPADALILRDAIVRGFYGAKPDAQSPTPQPRTGSAAAPARPDPAAAKHA